MKPDRVKEIKTRCVDAFEDERTCREGGCLGSHDLGNLARDCQELLAENERLLAALDELLLACPWTNSDAGHLHVAKERARAAIAKAKGHP